MNFIHENIQFNELSIKLFLHSVRYAPYHWHESIEILLVLKGKVNVEIEGVSYELKEEDVIVINNNHFHAINSLEDNTILALQIPTADINETYKGFNQRIINCKSFEFANDQQARFDSIRKLLAQMMMVYSKGEEGFQLKMQSLLFDLIHYLVKFFSIKTDKIDYKQSQKYINRLTNITNYINENYKSNISLNEVAEQSFLSMHYLSKFFQKYMGMTFVNYVASIRLEHAIKDLVYTDYPITQIALEHGFPNVKSFINKFREVYSETPSQYRKKITDQNQVIKDIKNTQMEYFEIDSSNAFSAITKYLNEELMQGSTNHKPIKMGDLKEIILTNQNHKVHHNWKFLTTIGKAKEGLIAEVQQHLMMVQREIGFKYIRFHGLFDDEMMVYSEDEIGNLNLNFIYIDKLFDFLLDIGLRPFVELGFMPTMLSKTKKTIFYRESIISMPKDMDNWCLLIRELMKHLINRYGLAEVKTWYFEVWNEPDFEGMFWYDKPEDYFELFQNTYQTIKSVDIEIKVGGPSLVSINIFEGSWIKRFIYACVDGKCIPDFLSIHSYPLNAVNGRLIKGDNFHPQLSEDVDYLSYLIKGTKKVMAEFGMDDKEIHITEWNSNTWHRDLCNDTCYKAAYITKNIVENMDEVNSFGYWTITDYIEELRTSHRLFHGGLGLITNNGIKKAGYFAYFLLNKLGTQMVDKGNGYYVATDGRSYQIMLYNYCHFDVLYRMRDVSNIDILNRYNVFKDNYVKEINLVLKGLSAGEYEMKCYRVNREHGSSFDEWLKMGHPEYLSQEEMDYLKSVAMPSYSKTRVNVECDFKVATILEPHEVVLYEVIQSI